jgi:hypothetical protein
MATKSVTVKRLPHVTPPEPKSLRLTIDLTLTEAEDIRRLCMHIGGNPEETRGVFDRIAEKLEEAGVNCPLRGFRLENERDGIRVAGLTFTDYNTRHMLYETHEVRH